MSCLWVRCYECQIDSGVRGGPFVVSSIDVVDDDSAISLLKESIKRGYKHRIADYGKMHDTINAEDSVSRTSDCGASWDVSTCWWHFCGRTYLDTIISLCTMYTSNSPDDISCKFLAAVDEARYRATTELAYPNKTEIFKNDISDNGWEGHVCIDKHTAAYKDDTAAGKSADEVSESLDFYESVCIEFDTFVAVLQYFIDRQLESGIFEGGCSRQRSIANITLSDNSYEFEAICNNDTTDITAVDELNREVAIQDSDVDGVFQTSNEIHPKPETHPAVYTNLHIQSAASIRLGFRPLLIFISGAAGTGKSTLTSIVSKRLGLDTIIGTDNVRHLMRHNVKDPILFASTYNAQRYVTNAKIQLYENLFGVDETVNPNALLPESSVGVYTSDMRQQLYEVMMKRMYDVAALEEKLGSKMCLEGYLLQCSLLLREISKLVDSVCEKRMSCIFEGVHLFPDFVDVLTKYIHSIHTNVIIFSAAIGIPESYDHKQRFATRSKDYSVDPKLNTYISELTSVRQIQSLIIKSASSHLSKTAIVVNRNIAEAVRGILQGVRGKIDESETEIPLIRADV